jgi:hypothetical protein
LSIGVSPYDIIADVQLTKEQRRHTAHHILSLASEWRMSIPVHIHGKDDNGAYLGQDGAPNFSAEFLHWIDYSWSKRGHRPTDDPKGGSIYKSTPQRQRTTRAFRKLRKRAPREFDVAYSLCVLDPISEIDWDQRAKEGRPFSDEDLDAAIDRTARKMNQKSRRKDTEHYDRETTLFLAWSAVDKLSRW